MKWKNRVKNTESEERERNNLGQRIQYAYLKFHYYCIKTVKLWLRFSTSCDILGIANKSKMTSSGCRKKSVRIKTKAVGINKLLQILSL